MKPDYETAKEEMKAAFAALNPTASVRSLGRKTTPDGWDHNAYSVLINGTPFPWMQGLGIQAHPVPAEVLAAACRDYDDAIQAGSFESWAEDNGYDTDSRRAEKIYQECLSFGTRLTAVGLTGSEILRFAEFARRL